MEFVFCFYLYLGSGVLGLKCVHCVCLCTYTCVLMDVFLCESMSTEVRGQQELQESVLFFHLVGPGG